MPAVELPDSLLPTLLPDGSFKPPERVFSVAKLESDELERLTRIVQRLITFSTENPNQATWDIRTADLLQTMPSLAPFAKKVDDFLLQFGASFKPPVQPGEGFSLKVFLNRASEDHMDIPRLWPAALSIGLLGTRELVGIVQASPEATIELASRLLINKTPLGMFNEIDGVPVERVTQQPGDVIVIGNFATLHSGYPSGYPLEPSAALAVASRNRQWGSDPQYIIDHYRQFYPGTV